MGIAWEVENLRVFSHRTQSDRNRHHIAGKPSSHPEFTPSHARRSTTTFAAALSPTQIGGLESRNRPKSLRAGMPDCPTVPEIEGIIERERRISYLHVKGLRESQRYIHLCSGKRVSVHLHTIIGTVDKQT
jgi:hypothetical protein